MKPTILVDFDGVLHSYSSGWQGAHIALDPPVPGAMRWLKDLTAHFHPAIYSSRSAQQGGIECMRNYIRYWANQAFAFAADADALVAALEFPVNKPPAFLTIDDRAVRFEGDFSRLDPKVLLAFKPWNKQG